MKKGILFLSLLVIFGVYFYSEINAQKGIEILFQGRTILQSTGKPVGTQLRFISPSSKTVFCRSNSIDGIFQTVLKSGVSYYVFIKDYVIADETHQIEIPFYAKYEEIDKDIYLKPIVPNVVLFNSKVFEPNDSVVKNADFFKLLKDCMEVNDGLKFEVEVLTSDSWFPNSQRTISVTDKKGKTTLKKVKYSSKEQLAVLLDARINAIKAELRKYQVYLKETAYIKNLQVIDNKKKMKKRPIPGKKNKFESYLPEFENIIIRTK